MSGRFDPLEGTTKEEMEEIVKEGTIPEEAVNWEYFEEHKKVE